MSDELEPTERSRIKSLINETVRQPTVGEVEAVFPHTGDEDRPSNHEVNVSVPPGPTPSETYRRRPVVVPTSGSVVTPREGDLVLLQFPRRSDQPFVTGVVYGDADDDRAPVGESGTVRFGRGDLEVQLAGDGSSARLALRPDATTSPDLVVEVDESGTIRLGRPDGSLKPIARQGDAVQVTDPDSGTLTGEITGGSSDVESS